MVLLLLPNSKQLSVSNFIPNLHCFQIFVLLNRFLLLLQMQDLVKFEKEVLEQLVNHLLVVIDLSKPSVITKIAAN